MNVLDIMGYDGYISCEFELLHANLRKYGQDVSVTCSSTPAGVFQELDEGKIAGTSGDQPLNRYFPWNSPMTYDHEAKSTKPPWLVVSNMFYFPFHIWEIFLDVILAIDELIFFKMVGTLW